MLRVTVLTANFSKNDVLLDPFKKFSFNINKKLLLRQPGLCIKACSSTKNSHETKPQLSENCRFSLSQPDHYVSLKKNGQHFEPFNNYISVCKRKENKRVFGTFNSKNKNLVMLSIDDAILIEPLFSNPQFSKKLTHHQPTLRLLQDNFTFSSVSERPNDETERETSTYSFEGGMNDEGLSGEKKADETRPSLETLLKVQQHLNENIPRLLSEKHDYSIYHKEVEFVNNWSNEQSYNTVGQMQYRLEITKLKLYVHVRMTSVKVSLLRTSVDQSDACVKVRWRISGIPHATTIRQLFEASPKQEIQEDWLDGFSTFYVATDGLIWKHVMDKISPEESPAKEGLMEKIARGMSLSS